MDEVKAIWRKCDAVCFDVDSTVLAEEGLDELARFMGKGDEIAKLTSQAMGGQMSFRESLTNRLHILAPSLEDVEKFKEQGVLHFTPGVEDLVKELQARSIDVYLVSGGFKSLIRPLAQKLNIPEENIYANQLIFTDGKYSGFDTDQPTSASGGKATVAQILKDTKGYKQLVFIGDGATDAEASPPADAFIGFGGNIVRESVKSLAKWYVYDFQELISELRDHVDPAN
ncbi:phosphoserine phosphatase-like [Watersipora subatra]|uniref:phosphoserine phosphatase-like n=1 Tax=Watersipora subatra TaxID=2589382 RepID=UPI00355BEA60